MSWLSLAIVSIALYSITNFIDKYLIEKKIRHASTATIFWGVFSLCIGLLLLAVRGFHSLPILSIFLLIISGIFLTLYIIPYFKALSLDDASRVIPLYQFYPVLTLIFSSIFLQEHLTIGQFFGFFLTLCGGFILGTERIEKRIFRFRPSFWLMVLSCLLYAFTGIIFKFVPANDFWLNIAYQTIGIGIGALLLLLYTFHKLKFGLI